MRSATRRKLLWLFFVVVVLFVIFYITYHFFILRLNAFADAQIADYVQKNIIMHITFGGLISVAVLIAAALIIDVIIRKRGD